MGENALVKEGKLLDMEGRGREDGEEVFIDRDIAWIEKEELSI
jgi:hypothetical protein